MAGSPFKTTTKAADEVIEKAPEASEAQAIDPIGRLHIRLFLIIIQSIWNNITMIYLAVNKFHFIVPLQHKL